MNILTGIDIPFTPFGGSPIICNDWYSYLPSDIHVRFLALPPNKSGYDHWWSMEDVVLLNVEKRVSATEFPSYVSRLKKEIEKQLDSYQPDIIHCQHLNFGFSRAIAEIETCHVPKMGICHGTDVQVATKSDFFLDNMKFIRSRMDYLLFPAQNMANDYFHFDPCEKPYVVIPHGIPDNAYQDWSSNTQNERRDQRFRVLYAGRLTSFKGADVVVSAMRYVSDHLHLTLIGDEDEPGYKQKILDEIHRYNLEQKVTLIGHLPRWQLWQEFSNHDLMVFPSTELECFSLTAVEAQAHGLVVAYHQNAGGIENTIGASGIRVENNSLEAWAYVLQSLSNARDTQNILNQYRRLGYANAEQYRITKTRQYFWDISKYLISHIQSGNTSHVM